MRFFLILFIFLLSACEAFRQAPPAIAVSGIPITNKYPPTVAPEPVPTDETEKKSTHPLKEFGDVRCHKNQFAQFNAQVKNFLSTSFNPQKANYTITCYHVPQWSGGFFIKGKIYFSGQKFDPESYNQNLSFSPSSYLEIHIVDISNRPVTNQGKPIRMNIDSYASYIQGQNPSLVFQDQKGKVKLNGTVKKNKHNQFIFTGSFEFENFVAWNGSNQGLSGSIGSFTLPACHFFECAKALPESL